MLPDGFKWDDFCDGHRLVYGTRTLAHTTLLPNGGCRATMNPGDLHRRTEFFDVYEAGQRYVEAWAMKWEARLREAGDRSTPLYAPGFLATGTERSQDQVPPPRRRKRRR